MAHRWAMSAMLSPAREAILVLFELAMACLEQEERRKAERRRRWVSQVVLVMMRLTQPLLLRATALYSDWERQHGVLTAPYEY